ncbi:ankyrin repeat-containing domain protein [Fusarium redolens]|uniref:Ankyrin repeat-containing domain protein n=1 Tax=Fusarium redolens TaxID=48865 RepID=A0A9P9K3B7_FUSRE|nr:ankyrin repeat-containing domain protein [Fusarium redolens]KAH7247572.1 ankyrin repeat-containing domain protein [Fusarium redolens]
MDINWREYPPDWTMPLELPVGISHILSRIGLKEIVNTTLTYAPSATADAFHVAASAGRTAVVEHLLYSTTLGSISQRSFFLGLEAAMIKGHSEVVKELFNHSHDYLEQNLIEGATIRALILSCIMGNVSMATTALSRFDLCSGHFVHDMVKSIFDDLTEHSPNGERASKMDAATTFLEDFSIGLWTPFMIASAFGNYNIIFLLAKCSGPDPTISETQFALWTALHNEDTQTMSACFQTANGILDKSTMMAMACFSGNTEFARLLLENGADVNMDLKGSTPLEIASSQGHEELIRVLKDNGANDPRNSAVC